MARGSSLWSRYLQAESRLVGLGLVEKRKEKKPPKKKPVWRESKSRDDVIQETPLFKDISITENDEKIYQRNIELLKNGQFMEEHHALYHIGLRARLALMAGYNYSKGSHFACGETWDGVLNAVGVFIDEETGMLHFSYAIEVKEHFPDVLMSVRDHCSVARGVKAFVKNNARTKLAGLDHYLLTSNYIEFINTLFDLDKFVKKGMIVRRNQDQLVFDIPLDLLDNPHLSHGMRKLLTDVVQVRRVVQREISPGVIDLFIANFLIPPSGLDWAHGYDQTTVVRVDGDNTHFTTSNQRSEAETKKKADLLNKLWK